EYQLTSIDLEIYELKTYRKNLKKFGLFEIRKNSIFAKKFYKILDEVDRMTIEIHELENKKSEILNLNKY
ncbi:MAG: hypothetical protein WCJ62_13685, partial [Flavobacterium sp.]